jgi:dolichyl-phosphate-mannose--protein O-mannosyl transferase
LKICFEPVLTHIALQTFTILFLADQQSSQWQKSVELSSSTFSFCFSSSCVVLFVVGVVIGEARLIRY